MGNLSAVCRAFIALYLQRDILLHLRSEMYRQHREADMSFSTLSVLSVLLWPLVVYHELIQRMYTGLEPILMKLDYSMKGDTEHRKHDKRSE